MILQSFSVFITRRHSENSIETATVTVTVQGHYDVRQAPVQGLTQTYMSSGPQDHQLRGSGGPTIFLVVSTPTHVTTLVNFFTLALCFHIVNFVKPQKA